MIQQKKKRSYSFSAGLYFFSFITVALISFVSIVYLAKYFDRLVTNRLVKNPNGSINKEESVSDYFNKGSESFESNSVDLLIQNDPFKEECSKAATTGGKTVVYSNTVCINE